MNTHPNHPTAAPVRRRSTRAQAAPLRIVRAGATDRGRERPANEDRFLIAPAGDAGCLLAVADGVGGVHGGETASTLTVESIEQRSLPVLRTLVAQEPAPDGDRLTEALVALVHQADARIAEEAAHRPDLHGMATTLTVALVLGRKVRVVHVGDSRCYLLRRGVLHRLTDDQTVAAELERRGLVSPEAAMHHRFRHVLTDFVGGGAEKLHVESREADLAAGDMILVCSDGLTEMVPEPAITSILLSSSSPEQACARLVACANEMGGIDNVTAVVARLEIAA